MFAGRVLIDFAFYPLILKMTLTSENFVITQAVLSDLNQLRELDRVCFDKDQWPLLELLAALVLPGMVHLKVVINGRMAGFIGGDTHQSDGVGWITTVGVLPDFRRRGIARSLLLACEEALATSAIHLSVRRSNLDAQRLYVDLGYKYFDVWKRYYADGEDALIMEKLNLKIG
jgi:ribosomal protein S18 acetylase RimI-like enzyme